MVMSRDEGICLGPWSTVKHVFPWITSTKRMMATHRSFMRLRAVWEPSRTTASSFLRPKASSRCRRLPHSSSLSP